jgi:hypothetical protein
MNSNNSTPKHTIKNFKALVEKKKEKSDNYLKTRQSDWMILMKQANGIGILHLKKRLNFFFPFFKKKEQANTIK